MYIGDVYEINFCFLTVPPKDLFKSPDDDVSSPEYENISESKEDEKETSQ